MFLSPANAGHYLIQRGLLDYSSLVHKRISVFPVDSLRAVLDVHYADLGGWILKQPIDTTASAVASLQVEAVFYDIVNRLLPLEISKHLPRMVEYDGNIHVLILERVGFANAWIHLLRSSDAIELVATPIAMAYQALHQANNSLDEMRPAIRASVPWILTLAYSSMDEPDNFSFIRNDQQIAESLACLAGEWNGEYLIHGDAKLENVMISRDTSHAWLIDWSQVSFGDPAWDIAGIVQSALSLWTLGLHIDPALGLSVAPDNETFTHKEISSFIQTFLKSYGVIRNDFLTRVFKMAGARMLQTVFEGSERNQVRNHYHLAMLRMAKSALTDPDSLRMEYAG